MDAILLVDDEVELARLIGAHLKQLGYQVKRHNSVRGAIELAREIKPVLVLLDVMLGDGAGYQVARQLRQDDALYAVPILFMSSLGDPEEQRYAFENGADDYLVKPFNPMQLQEKIEALMALRQQITTLDPVCRLPQLPAMLREIAHRLAKKESFGLVCAEIEGLDGYVEKKGRAGLDTALQFMAALLVQEIRNCGIRNCYVSHIEGAYFCALVGIDDHQRFTQQIVASFRQRVHQLFTDAERAREDMIMSGQLGSTAKSIMMSLRVSVVHTQNRSFRTGRHMLDVLAETHNLLDGCVGNAVIVDRKKDYTGPVFGKKA